MSQPIIIRVYKGNEIVQVKQFADLQQIVIGSSGGGVHLHLPGISAIHAAVESRPEGYAICDLGSEKGTIKNGQKILDESIKHGDKVMLGEYTLEFFVGSITEQAAAPAQDMSRRSSDFDDVTVPGFQMSAMGGMESHGGHKKKKGHKTFAPPSSYKNLRDYVKPTKGTSIEVVVAWQERILATHHFSEKGTVSIGTDPKADIIVPLLTSGSNLLPLVQVDSLASVFLHPGFDGELIGETGTIPFSSLGSSGRVTNNGASGVVQLKQGEMVLIHLNKEVNIAVRYATTAPKPLLIPFIDFSSNGFLSTLLAIVIAGILALFVALNAEPEKDKDEEEEKYRTALIIENIPKPPPPPKVEVEPEPPKEPPPPKEEPKRVKPVEKKVEEQKKVEKPKPEAQPDRPRIEKTSKDSGTKGGGNDKSAAALKPRPGPITNKAGSVKQGGAVKTTNKPTAQAQSTTKDPKDSGIFSVFGTSGRQDKLNKDYGGAKNGLAGLADEATGEAGFDENRDGKGLGSHLKETGATGTGKSNVGVSGIPPGGKGLGGQGTGFSGSGTGLGGRKAVSIDVGGSDAEFSGSIDKEAIRRVMVNNQRAIRNCYERDLNSDSSLGGKLLIQFDIGEHGRVSNAKPLLDRSTMSSAAVANCIVTLLRTWRFPDPPRNQVVEVVYPFAFSPK